MKRFKWAVLLLAGISLLAAARLGIQKSEWFDQSSTLATSTSDSNAAGTTAVVPSLPADAQVIFGEWTQVGPTNFSGAAQDIAVDSHTGDLYALSREGWIFKSSDNAGTWTPVVRYDAPVQFNTPPAAALQLAIQRDASSIKAFLIVVEGSIGGDLMRIKPDGTSAKIASNVLHVKAVGNRIYVARWGGAAMSDTNGTTWTGGVLGTAEEHLGCWDIEASGTNVYLMCSREHYTGAFSRLEVYRSVAGGQFTKVWTMPDSYPTGQFGQEKWATLGRLAVSRSNPDVVYASYAQDAKFEGGAHVFRSTDGGTSWSLRTELGGANPFNAALLTDFDARCSAESATANASYLLEVDPVDSDVVWIGNLELYRSDDGGLNFGRASVDDDKGTEAYNLPRAARAIRFGNGFNGGSDRSMYVATARGVYKSDDARATVQDWQATTCNSGAPSQMAWQLRVDGYATVDVVAAHVDPTGEVLATLGPEGSGGLYHGHLNDSSGWARLSKERPKHVSIDPVRGMDRYFTSKCQGARWCRWDWNSLANSWTVTASVTIQQEYEDYDFFVQDPTNSSRYWGVHGGKIYRSHDAMATWNPANTPQYFTPTSGAVAPYDPNLVLVGSDNGYIYRNANALAADSSTWWTPIRPTNLGNWIANGIVFDPSRPRVVYMMGTTYAFMVSTDGGLNWTPTQVGTGDGLSLAIDPANSDVLYLGTSNGLFVSWTRTPASGPAWHEVPTPFASAAVRKLVVRTNANGSSTLYAFTAGRGIWAASLKVQRFADVPFNHWAFDFIERLAGAGITKGCATNPQRYCPTNLVNRAEMAVFLLRSIHGSSYQPPVASGDFSDVPTNQWAAAWVEQLREEGITQGCATGPLRYCPDGSVTRDQMAVFLLRAKHGASYQPPAATGMFEDVPASHWAAAWIEQLAREGVTSGCSSTPKNYCPTSEVTRDQMAVFLTRAFAL